VTCWAYYPGPDEVGRAPEEFLRHSIGVAEYLFNNLAHVTTPVIRKVSRMLGVSEDLVSDAVLLTGLLHDLGKACACYQEKPWEGFSGHWLLSAGIVYNIITNPLLKTPVDTKMLTRLFVYPILLHHYAQTDLIMTMRRTIMDSIRLHSDCTEPVRGLITYGLGRIRTGIGTDILNALLEDLSDGDLVVFPIPDQVWGEFTNRLFDPRRLASMVMAGLLNEADGTIAKMNRNIR
jgi:hypothetical protein